MCAKKMDILKKFLIIFILSIVINKINGASIAQTSGSESMRSTADLPKDQDHVPMNESKVVITVLSNNGINKEVNETTKTVVTPFGQVVIKQLQTETTNEIISNGSTSTESPSTHTPMTSIPGLIPAATETPTIKKPYPTDMHKQGQIIIR